MANEEWRPVVGWEGVYEVSDQGRLRSLPRVSVTAGKYCRVMQSRMLSNRKPNRIGYMAVALQHCGRRVPALVHRLVCEAFHGPPPSNLHEVAHNNGERSDNRADNLRWDTRRGNLSDKEAHGTSQVGGRNPCAKLSEKIVREIRLRPDESLAALAREFGVDTSTVWKVRHRRSWKHIYD